MFFEMYKDAMLQWRWHLYASNGRIIADSAEGYFNESDCLHGINLVKGAYNAPVRKR